MRSVASVCLSVYNALTFESLALASSFFGTRVHRQNLQVKFVYIKVIGLRSRSQGQRHVLGVLIGL